MLTATYFISEDPKSLCATYQIVLRDYITGERWAYFKSYTEAMGSTIGQQAANRLLARIKTALADGSFTRKAEYWEPIEPGRTTAQLIDGIVMIQRARG